MRLQKFIRRRCRNTKICKGRKVFLDEGRKAGDLAKTCSDAAERFIEDIKSGKPGKEEAKNHIYNLKHYANKIYNETLEAGWAKRVIKSFKEPSIIKCGRRHLIPSPNESTVLLENPKQNGIEVKVAINEFQFLNPDARKFYECLLALE